MTLMQGVRLYPKAVFWSMFISTCIIMEGYQLSLTNNFCKPLGVSPMR
jgi:SP family general alpha glucoside:H+ symporter-like MFS transporter